MAASRTTPRKVPRQQRAQETVDAILEATRRLLVERGYHHTSTAKVAQLAGVSVGSLYQYFPNKEALVLALSRRHSERMMVLFRERFEASRALPLRDAIRLIIQTEVDALRHDPALMRVLFEHVPRIEPPQHIVAVQALVIDALAHELRTRTEGLAIADPARVAFFVVYAIEGICQGALQHNPEMLGSAELLDHCTELVLHQFEARRGPREG